MNAILIVVSLLAVFAVGNFLGWFNFISKALWALEIKTSKYRVAGRVMYRISSSIHSWILNPAFLERWRYRYYRGVCFCKHWIACRLYNPVMRLNLVIQNAYYRVRANSLQETVLLFLLDHYDNVAANPLWKMREYNWRSGFCDRCK